MQRRTALSHHIIQFCRHLRHHEFNIGPQEESEALIGLEGIDWSSSTQLKWVLQGVLCKSYLQTLQFDDLYFDYWKDLSRSVDSKVKEVATEAPKKPKPQPPGLEEIKQWLHGHKKQQEEVEMAQASDAIAKGELALGTISQHQLNEWPEVIKLLQRMVDKVPNRRYVKSNHPRIVNFRDTINHSMRYGGELAQLRWKQKKKNKTQIILLCDVSRSMELYSRFMLQMMYSLQNSQLSLRTFVFSTSIYDITKKLQTQHINQAISSLTGYVDEWSGGTRIGECLHHFHKSGRKYLHKKTLVFVVSDGWDSGDTAQLSCSMKKIRSRVNKLIWINPLANSTNFKPEVQGMQAALPHIDFLVPVLDVGGLRRWLTRI